MVAPALADILCHLRVTGDGKCAMHPKVNTIQCRRDLMVQEEDANAIDD